jgi:diguanylate cyclase (GGDEF)-like protein
MADKSRILIVDDDPDLLHLLTYSLDREGFEVQQADSGEEGLRVAQEFHPQIVITDLMMPGMDGTQLCREIKANPDLHPVYVIMLTAKGEADTQISNLRVGADEYMVKPAVMSELRARIQVGLRWIASQDQLKKMATSDSLTGLPNRYVLNQFLERAMPEVLREKTPLSLILLDLDDFKGVNDSFGHVVGDKTLQKLADIIRKQVRSTDIPARYGGDEFVIVLPGVDQDFALRIARRLHTTIATKLWSSVIKAAQGMAQIEGLDPTRQLTASIGVASYPEYSAKTGEDLLRAADSASYYAKQTGRNRVCLFQAQTDDRAVKKAGPEPSRPDPILPFDLPQLYTAMERISPMMSAMDPALPGHLLEIAQARAVGWVQWSENGNLQFMGSAGAMPEAAEKLSHYLPWENASFPSDALNYPLPSRNINHLNIKAVDRVLTHAIMVPATDSEGDMIGGLWLAWDRKIALPPAASFLLSWLGRILGMEIELDRLKAKTKK